MNTYSVHLDAEQHALRFKWIESERAGRDLGELAIRQWVHQHWAGHLRSRWMEHLRGERFWVELDRGDFALLKRSPPADSLLLDRILDRFAEGHENLDIIRWAHEWGVPLDPVLRVLETLDINGRRLASRFEPPVPVVTLDPAWLAWEDGTVPRLARAIDQERDFASLPILGDALEEAGCTDPAVLGHCRHFDPGLRWSWLIDLILWGP